MITKLMGINNYLIHMGTSFSIQNGYLIDLSSSCKEILMNFISPRSTFWQTDRAIMLTLAHKSHNSLLKLIVPITQGSQKTHWIFKFGWLFVMD